MYRNKANIPFGTDLGDLIRKNASDIIREIESNSDEYYERVSTDEYLEYLVSKYELPEIPIIHWEETQLEIGETRILGADLPRRFGVMYPTGMYPFKEVSYYIPFSGSQALLYYKPSNIFRSGGINGKLKVAEDCLILSIVDLSSQPKEVDNEFNRSKQVVINRLHDLNTEIEKVRSDFPTFIRSEINKRLMRMKKFNEYKSQFSFPIKRKEGVPESFQLPKVVKKKRIKPKPIHRSSNPAENEFHISEDDFQDLLSILQDCGRNWEQHPETYRGKDEEALRDQLIFVLAPNIEGVVTGEAYNKKGKTDIAIKHGSNNLFIGECKIWKGASSFRKTIDQILGYLTWRDSKSAIMMFVPNKDISSVIISAKQTAENHPNFVRKLEIVNDGWINYRFHLDGDEGCYLTIAVHLYHMPEL